MRELKFCGNFVGDGDIGLCEACVFNQSCDDGFSQSFRGLSWSWRKFTGAD